VRVGVCVGWGGGGNPPPGSILSTSSLLGTPGPLGHPCRSVTMIVCEGQGRMHC